MSSNTDFDPNDFGQASDLMESVAGNLKGISQGVVIEHDGQERLAPQKRKPRWLPGSCNQGEQECNHMIPTNPRQRDCITAQS